MVELQNEPYRKYQIKWLVSDLVSYRKTLVEEGFCLKFSWNFQLEKAPRKILHFFAAFQTERLKLYFGLFFTYDSCFMSHQLLLNVYLTMSSSGVKQLTRLIKRKMNLIICFCILFFVSDHPFFSIYILINHAFIILGWKGSDTNPKTGFLMFCPSEFSITFENGFRVTGNEFRLCPISDEYENLLNGKWS